MIRDVLSFCHSCGYILNEKMTETQNPQKNSISAFSPFGDSIDPKQYFPGSSVERIRKGIHEGLRALVPIFILTGSQGSGKTMICRRLEAEIGRSYTIVFFPRTVDSFVDVVRIIAMRLGLLGPELTDEVNVDELVSRIGGHLQTMEQPLFLVFDEVENIYLATLERIRKMFDSLMDKGTPVHLLFSGCPGFLENYDQLSICNFMEVEELFFEIEPLSAEETEKYLAYGCHMLHAQGEKVQFSKEVKRHIIAAAQGNYRTINVLAEEARHTRGDDTSFMVLLGNVCDEVEKEPGGWKQVSVRELFEEYKVYLPWSAGLLLLVGLVAFIFGSAAEQDSGDYTTGKAVPAAEKNITTTEGSSPVAIPPVAAEQPVGTEPEKSVKTVELLETGHASAVVSEVSLPTAAEVTAGISRKIAGIVPEPEPVDESDERTGMSPERAAGGGPPASVVRENPVTITDMEGLKLRDVEQFVDDSGNRNRDDVQMPSAVDKIDMVELQPTGRVKRKPGARFQKSEKMTILKRNLKTSPRPNEAPRLLEARKKKVVRYKTSPAVETLFRKRIAAGRAWEKGRRDHKYTIQLMVLGSDTAERNLKKKLEDVKYRQEAGNFYLFQEAGNSRKLLVFYGEYDSMEKARSAKNSLPQFLKEENPYPLGVRTAMKKVGR